jgi:putative Mg2+ transporter-C (MgtC) family protein
VGLLPQLTLFGRIVLAAFLGYVIGYERELRGKPAGERTFALVAIGSAAVTGLGVEAFPVSAEKVIAGVITGVGFLGAGLIIREGGAGMVRGLTTAASSWAAAAIGILAGAGIYLVAALSTVLVLLILESNRLPIVRAIEPGRLGRADRPGRPDRDDADGEDAG